MSKHIIKEYIVDFKQAHENVLTTMSVKEKKKKRKHKAPPDAKALNLLTGKWLHAAT